MAETLGIFSFGSFGHNLDTCIYLLDKKILNFSIFLIFIQKNAGSSAVNPISALFSNRSKQFILKMK